MLLRSLRTALFAMLIASAPAGAATITFQDVFDPADVFMVDSSSVACAGTNLAGVLTDTATPSGGCNSLSFTHTLIGYRPSDTLQSATITVYVKDDGNDSAEKFTLSADLNAYWTKADIPGSGDSSAFGPLSVFAEVVGDGVLSILIRSDFSAGRNHVGDFYFQKSVLNAEWLADAQDPEPPLPAPEPMSLLLFGTGAVLVAQSIRKARA